jgi:hypothetical protein
MKIERLAIAMALAGALGMMGGPLDAQSTPEQHLAAIKQSLASSQVSLRKYEWIETTVLSVKGEEKSRKQQRAYYGADGKLQKLPVAGAPQQPQAEQGRGGRGRRGGRVVEQVVENKKDEMQDYMERAVALVHRYVPPDPAQIQAARDAKRMAAAPPAGGRVRVSFTDYILKGDMLAIDLDVAANRLAGISVSTYLDAPDEAVKLNVRMDTLTDGTVFTGETTLDVAEKNIRVVIQNTGHRPLQ